jgi:hypothetical protein
MEVQVHPMITLKITSHNFYTLHIYTVVVAHKLIVITLQILQRNHCRFLYNLMLITKRTVVINEHYSDKITCFVLWGIHLL